jgi:hypothetical protein
VLVEQATFASARSESAAGYHLVAASCGLTAGDARELTQWGPSHDSLWEAGQAGMSCNFFPLESGSFCVSKTTAAGLEYSGRGGAQVQTQCLVVPAEVLARFANDPFAVLRAAAATGEFDPGGEPPSKLAPLRLSGRGPTIDHLLLAQLAINPGSRAMAALVQQAISAERLVLVGSQGQQCLAGLISCLPTELRMQFSLSTGLKLSPRRPFRLSAAPADSAGLRRWAREFRADVLILGSAEPAAIEAGSWAAVVESALAESKLSQLAAEVVHPHAPAIRPAAAEPIVARAAAENVEPVSRIASDSESESSGELNGFAESSSGARESDEPASRTFDRADASHQRFAGDTAGGVLQAVSRPAVRRPAQCEPDVLDLLERLDGLVFEAIDGSATALAALVEFWPEILTRLGEEGIADAREQYLRYALAVWQQTDARGVHDPLATLAALDVLCLLFPLAD